MGYRDIIKEDREKEIPRTEKWRDQSEWDSKVYDSSFSKQLESERAKRDANYWQIIGLGRGKEKEKRKKIDNQNSPFLLKSTIELVRVVVLMPGEMNGCFGVFVGLGRLPVVKTLVVDFETCLESDP